MNAVEGLDCGRLYAIFPDEEGSRIFSFSEDGIWTDLTDYHERAALMTSEVPR